VSTHLSLRATFHGQRFTPCTCTLELGRMRLNIPHFPTPCTCTRIIHGALNDPGVYLASDFPLVKEFFSLLLGAARIAGWSSVIRLRCLDGEVPEQKRNTYLIYVH